MMFPSHLLATILLGLVIHRFRPLSPTEWVLAIAFGVVIDLDHVLQLPAYVATHGLASLTPGEMMRWGGAWQGFMHTPWALLGVAAACFAFASWVPALFWSLHMFQDFVVARHLVHFGGPVEWLIVAALLAAVLAMLALDHRVAPRNASFVRHAGATFGVLKR